MINLYSKNTIKYIKNTDTEPRGQECGGETHPELGGLGGWAPWHTFFCKFWWNFFLLRLCSRLLWEGGRIRSLFSCVSCEAAKSVSRCSASTVWDYAGFLCSLYQDAGPKRCQHSLTSRAQSPLNPFHTWSNMWLTGLYHPHLDGITLLLSNSSILFLSLPLSSFLHYIYESWVIITR